MSLIGETAGPAAGDIIKDGSDAGFMADVVEASRVQPVIVDFWATWCGPCRQLGPALEKAVLAAKGAVKLVKIDIDKHPAVAGQLRVQSIPAVFAFVERLAKAGGADDGLDELLAMARESLELGDFGGAAQAYAQVLQQDPDNVKALGGLARVYVAGGEPDRAREILQMAPADAKDPDLDSVRAALALAADAPADVKQFQDRLAADPADHEARFELAKALSAHGRLDEAVDQLLTIIEADRDWNEQAARKQLLTVFEAAGQMSELAKQGRRRLSAILFS